MIHRKIPIYSFSKKTIKEKDEMFNHKALIFDDIDGKSKRVTKVGPIHHSVFWKPNLCRSNTFRSSVFEAGRST